MLLLFVNCQKEHLINEDLEQDLKTQKSTTKTVSASDIPEVMNFISSKSADYKFVLDDSNNKKGMNFGPEDNLVMTELITDEITQATNAYQKSSYTFKLIKQSNKQDGNYFLNLVVKEYKDTFYLYIVKYVPDENWLSTHSITKDFGDFTGHMYFYSDQGIYIANVTMQSGSSTASERNSCYDDTDGGTDIPDDDGGTGGSGGGGSGGSGTTCTITIEWYECGGTFSDIPHPAEGCEGPNGGGSGFTATMDCEENTEANQGETDSFNSFLRTPCEGGGGASGGGTSSCQPDPNNPCEIPYTLDENCDCVFADAIENNDVVVLIDKDDLSIVNNCMDLDFDQTQTVVNNHLETVMADYITLNGCSTETNQFLEEAIVEFDNILEELPDAKFERYLELKELIEEDPWVLIRDCAEENGLDIGNYQYLYNHTLPTECTNRLESLPEGFNDQPLDTGNASVANVDYYGVEITTRPDINGDGNQDTDAEIFQAYKENFHNLASGGQEDFQFSCSTPGIGNIADVGWEFTPYFNSDWGLWLSSNPVTTIFEIDAWAEGFPFAFIADDGAIMISEFTSNYWIGSTIQTPNTETQPFSGNRQWGFLTNQNGNLELYARAVDVARISDVIDNLPPYFNNNECQEDTYYNIGEATWSNLQQEIKQFILDYGGQANVIPKTAVRFDKTKLKEALESNESIDQINCN